MARPTHGYQNAAGERIPGVTTIIGLLDKPALVGWAGRLCTEAGHRAGLAGEPAPNWRDVCYGKRDKAAADGTRAHDLFERHLKGEKIVRTDRDSDGAWNAYQQAKRWLELTGLEFEVWSHERPLVSTGFGGTPDAICREPDGRIMLADWKTGGTYPEHLIQLAAYRHLLYECEGIWVEGAHLVRFSRDHGDFHHHSWGSDALNIGWRVFEALLQLWHPYKELKARVK